MNQAFLDEFMKIAAARWKSAPEAIKAVKRLRLQQGAAPSVRKPGTFARLQTALQGGGTHRGREVKPMTRDLLEKLKRGITQSSVR